MAANRRRTASGDSDDEPETTQKQVKRAKVEKNGKASRRTNEPDTDDEDQDDHIRYNGDELAADAQLEDSEIPEEAAMAAYTEARLRNKDRRGIASEAGVIKSIQLVDFMCHKNLSVDFGSRMNFLVGHNGSGKSAILTAISVALGGKTRLTDRATGVKDLIRSGADKATIILTLSNQGYNAYQPKDKDFSPNVVIERSFTRTGGSEWKFKATKEGKPLSKKRSELDAILTHFSIDVDQPLTILTQDNARKFLHNASDEQLYNFFMQGTQLEEMSNRYNEADKSIVGIAHTVERMVAEIPEKKARVKELDKKLEATKRIAEQKKRMKALQGEQGWSLVIEKEKHRDSYQVAIDEADTKISYVEDKLAEVERDMAPTIEAIREQEEAIKAFETSRKPIDTERRKAKLEYEALQRQVQELEMTMSDYKRTITRSDNDIAVCDRQLHKLKEQAEGGRSAAQIKNEEDLKKYMELENKLVREIPRKEEEVRRAKVVLEEADGRIMEARNRVGYAQDELGRLSGQVKGLERQQTNSLAGFGEKIEMVIQMIQRARWHGPPPVGPLGQYVKLRNFEYKDLVEANLGQTLCAFAIQDSRDRGQLQKILKDASQRGYVPGFSRNRDAVPSILVSSGDMFDYSSGDMRMYAETMMSLLDFSDEYVKRVLINQAAIERSFVAYDQDQAVSEMHRLLQAGISRINIYNVKPNLQRQEGDGRTTHATPLQDYRGSNLFVKDVAADLDRARGAYDAKHREWEDLTAAVRQLQQERDQLQNELSRNQDALRKTTNGLEPTRKRVADLREKVQEQASDQVTALEIEKQQYVDGKTTTQVLLESVSAENDAKTAEMNAAFAKVQDLQAQLDNFAPERKRKQDRVADLMAASKQLRMTKGHYIKSKENTEAKRAAAQKDYDAADALVKTWTESIENAYPERVETERAPKTIKKELEAVEKAIKEAEKRQGVDVDMVRAQFIKATEELKHLNERKIQLEALVISLNMHLRARQLWWMEMRKCCCIKVMSAFVGNTGQRGFEGRLDFNHNSSKLFLHVKTRQGATQDVDASQLNKSAKQLSGGERSFSTVSFLLAMWETASGPLRCLDEWDVFLDAANRKLAAKLLIEGARSADAKQYILITPQDMSTVDIDGSDTKVIRMADPERDQGVLPFQPA